MKVCKTFCVHHIFYLFSTHLISLSNREHFSVALLGFIENYDVSLCYKIYIPFLKFRLTKKILPTFQNLIADFDVYRHILS
jgi:hypothetical protein